ncbi:MAG: MoxR family ATPase [Planctomycetota bacterium]|jgi:MoxR-like ATPase|nr:MoxR family ATPase [Planctomycetota bacterium]MDP6761292.1 MoxR family ATPase [Planctomycetota bacterium]MDP6990816.1 MoxR family ATPase [Planctomycetota bacterium]
MDETGRTRIDDQVALARGISTEVARAVVGMEEELAHCLMAVAAGGHVLLEGPPGVAKTLLVRSLAAALGGTYGRIQFTPDLMPADVTGTSVFRADEGTFRFQPGPVFAHVLLCDEVNRAPAKTQAALLEAMQEGSVTVDGERHDLPAPNTVFATMNPLEHEGTYPLPEAQLDRFLFKVLVAYPEEAVEARLLETVHDRPPCASPGELGVDSVCDPARVEELRAAVRAVEVREDLPAYVVRLLRATREDPSLLLGASPRAGVMLLAAAKACAALGGRDFVTPDDLKRVALPALRHRVLLDPAEEIEGGTTDDVLARILDTLEVPR